MLTSKCLLSELTNKWTHELIKNDFSLINSKFSHNYGQVGYLYVLELSCVKIQKHISEIFALLIYDLLFLWVQRFPNNWIGVMLQRKIKRGENLLYFLPGDNYRTRLSLKLDCGRRLLSSSFCVRLSQCSFIILLKANSHPIKYKHNTLCLKCYPYWLR